MKFSEYQNELNEAFDRPAQITNRRGNQSYFMIGQNEYMIGLYYDDSERKLSVDFMMRPAGESSYYYTLAKGDTKDALTVFATVISEIKRKMKTDIVNIIEFSAFADSDSSDARKRERLYKRMAERFSKEIGFKLSASSGDFVLHRTKIVEAPTGYDTAWGTETLDVNLINDAAIVKVTGGDGEWRLDDWNKLIVKDGKVTLTSGSINSDDAWYDAFFDLEWDDGDEEWIDGEQEIAIINGKVWVINGTEITIWKSISDLEMQSEGLTLSSTTLHTLGY
ncbi:hypothetical protein VPFG_00164 [Vibrio phage nt-1]|uniref:Uncharacterized protein n=1 Tax=Vibrio phage nt-1 TaxID=115992 RepID=R9TEI5_9CAUD|nr:hypothetical protein VPFG_00164 [Vibrio phage nt-1]AGN30166.1 hypothetical protein VPFG_00164 [Vibrio phage nt-1]